MNNGFELGLILPSADCVNEGAETATLPRETRSAADDLYFGRPGVVRQAGVSSPYAAEAEALQRIHSEVGLDVRTFNREATVILRPTLAEPPDVYQQEVQARMAETTRVFES